MDIVVVLIIVLIIVAIWRGPKVLPEWGAAIGKTVREARTHATKGLDGSDNEPKSLSDGSVGEPMASSTTATSADTTSTPRS
jgi:Sec-independent protein translocase protein TatA